MRNLDLAHRAGRLALVPVLAGAAVFGVATPAVAAPQPQSAGRQCGVNIGEGVNLCLITTRKPDGSATVSAAVAFVEERTLKAALVVLEACDGESCNAEAVATGEGVREVSTKPQGWGRGVGYYRANASWVDDKWNTHTGEVFTPE